MYKLTGKSMVVLLVTLVLALAVGCSQAAPTPTSAPTKPAPTAAAPAKTVQDAALIGFTNPLSGVYAASSREPMLAAELLNGEINQQGGVPIGNTKYTLKWLIGDSLGTTAGGTKIAEEWTRQYPDLRIVLSASSIANPAIGDVTGPKKVVLFGITYDTEFVSAKHGFNFRTMPQVLEFSPSFWKWMSTNRSSVKNVMTVFQDDLSGQRSTDAIVKSTKKYGQSVVGSEFYPGGTTDFYPVASRVLAKNPDAVEFFYYATGFAKQLRELGYKGQLIASAPREGMWKDIPANVTEGMLFQGSVEPTDEKNTPKVLRDVAQKYTATLNIPAPPFALYWHQTYQLAVEALKGVGSLDGDAIKNYIQTQAFNSAWGPVRAHGKEIIGMNNWILYPQPLVQMKGGKPETLTVFDGEAVYKDMVDVYAAKQ